jgi:hypothetical protein
LQVEEWAVFWLCLGVDEGRILEWCQTGHRPSGCRGRVDGPRLRAAGCLMQRDRVRSDLQSAWRPSSARKDTHHSARAAPSQQRHETLAGQCLTRVGDCPMLLLSGRLFH